MARASGSGLKLRILSAVALGLPTLLLLWAGGTAWRLFVAAAGAVLAWEWTVLCRGAGSENQSASLASRAAVILAVPAAVVISAAGSYDWALAVLGLGVVVALAGSLSALAHGAWLAAGIAYVGLPCLAIVWLRDGTRGLAVLLWIMALVWATDTAAYAAGRRLGGPKLAPRVSPNKTWSGLLGGVLGAAVAGGIVGAILDARWILLLAILSALLAVVEQAGDLAESAVKRRFGVKDASNIIPGHGGLLDRVDGLLAVVAAVWLLDRGGWLSWS